MGLLRFFVHLLRKETTRARYTYTAPTDQTTGQPARLVSVRVTTQTMVAAVAEAGAVLTGKAWVIDGDTLDIGGKRIRLAGIDAPELDHPYGRNAKSALIRLCQGHQVSAVFHGESSYDRSMATCTLPDGRDLSAEMVRAGMAIDWPRYSGGKYRALEVDGIRRKLWRCDARQKGRMPPLRPDQD
ncbi:thermonuclease family protein [Rhodobacter sp. Har01]|uniref:thermonuclease family protein n=1 Tax=Rhodobacter sp. Har01 TaxID=2883999 RepID=UPI001D06A6F7|nr:thermonuclease family protein [Rhodobacter sp. Har01]MCB6177660.1 thermonuclease family protein [Rhodobacter sp. Har01]